jgi:hypothetical protein
MSLSFSLKRTIAIPVYKDALFRVIAGMVTGYRVEFRKRNFSST